MGLVSRDGKVLFSRQFISMRKTFVEALYSRFSRKIPAATSGSKSSSSTLDHSLIEDENCRYIFQPLDGSIFLVLVTLPTSNVVLDFQQLRSLATIISSIAGEKNRLHGLEDMMRNVFPIIHAIDETFFPLSIPDSCSISAVQTALEMYSQAEKMEDLVIKDKERETKEKAKEKLKQLEAIRKEKKASASSMAASTQPVMPTQLVYTASQSPTDNYNNGSSFVAGSTSKSGGMQLSKKKSQIPSTLINTSGPVQKKIEVASIEQVSSRSKYTCASDYF